MAQLFETLCMMLAFKESHSLAVHYCRLVWDVRSLSIVIFITLDGLYFWYNLAKYSFQRLMQAAFG